MKRALESTLISRGSAITSLLCALALAGCGDPKLHSEITEFDKSVQALEAPISSFYTKANDTHRDLYLDEVKMNPGMQLAPEMKIEPGSVKVNTDHPENGPFENEDGKYPTGLTAYYSADYIKVRIVAVRALAKYSGKLNELATSTAPSDAEQSINKLGTELESLSADLSKIGSKHNKNANLNLASFSTPIAHLTALAAGNFLEWLRDKWLKDNLSATSNDINTLCTSIENDLDLTAKRVKSRAATDLVAHEQAFNNSGTLLNGPSSSSDRTQFLTDSAKVGKVQYDIDQANPTDLLRKVKLIHQRIIEQIGKRKPPKIKHGKSTDAGGNDG